MICSSCDCEERYAAKSTMVPVGKDDSGGSGFDYDLIGRNLQGFSRGVKFRQIMICDATARRDRESD